jgi:hypothetical protein
MEGRKHAAASKSKKHHKSPESHWIPELPLWHSRCRSCVEDESCRQNHTLHTNILEGVKWELRMRSGFFRDEALMDRYTLLS